MSKVTLHTIGTAPEWVGDFVQVAGATHIKGMHVYPQYPGVQTIGRIYHDGAKEPEPLASLMRAGAAGGDEVFELVWPEMEKNDPGILWELYNEAPIWDTSVLAGFVAFNQQLIRRVREVDRKVCVGAINTGWPVQWQMETVIEAAQGADGLSLHHYAPADIRDSEDMFRYRILHDWCEERKLSHPRIYLTEIGLDQVGGPDHGHWGWHSILDGDEDLYVKMLVWYEQQLRLDDYVQAATIFATGGGWDEFEFGQSAAMKLAGRLAELGPNSGTEQELADKLEEILRLLEKLERP